MGFQLQRPFLSEVSGAFSWSNNLRKRSLLGMLLPLCWSSSAESLSLGRERQGDRDMRLDRGFGLSCCLLSSLFERLSAGAEEIGGTEVLGRAREAVLRVVEVEVWGW